jgi:hypothetical protein
VVEGDYELSDNTSFSLSDADRAATVDRMEPLTRDIRWLGLRDGPHPGHAHGPSRRAEPA